MNSIFVIYIYIYNMHITRRQRNKKLEYFDLTLYKLLSFELRIRIPSWYQFTKKTESLLPFNGGRGYDDLLFLLMLLIEFYR
jgi:hypothetical protein